MAKIPIKTRIGKGHLEVSPLTSFTFNPTPVKIQLVNCTSVMTEMVPALSADAISSEKRIIRIITNLKTAGVDDIIAEKQVQLDAWKQSK